MASKFRTIFGGIFLCLLALLPVAAEAAVSDKKASLALSHYIMGAMYDRLGELDQAIQEYKKALAADNKNSVIHLNLASAYVKKNDIPKAIDEVNLASKLQPEAVEPHAILALLYLTQDKTDLSAQEYEIALKNASKLEPKNVDIYKSLGLVYLQQKKLKDAENTYRLILELTPQDAQAHLYLGSIYTESNDSQRAVKELKEALALNPDYPEALNYLGYLYAEENKNLTEAEEMIKKALKLDPDNGAYLDSLGWVYFQRGRFKEAIELLSRAASLLEDPVIFEHLGDAYFKTGDPAAAELNWQKALKLNPANDKVKKKIEELDKFQVSR